MANNRLAYGLCKKYGIDLPSGATPQQAWEALKKKGVTQENASEKMSAPAGKTEEKSKGGTKGAEKGKEKAQKYGKMYLDYENKLKNAKTEDEIMDVSKQLDEKFGLEVRDNGDNLEIYDPKKRESVNSFAKNTNEGVKHKADLLSNYAKRVNEAQSSDDLLAERENLRKYNQTGKIDDETYRDLSDDLTAQAMEMFTKEAQEGDNPSKLLNNLQRAENSGLITEDQSGEIYDVILDISRQDKELEQANAGKYRTNESYENIVKDDEAEGGVELSKAANSYKKQLEELAGKKDRVKMQRVREKMDEAVSADIISPEEYEELDKIVTDYDLSQAKTPAQYQAEKEERAKDKRGGYYKLKDQIKETNDYNQLKEINHDLSERYWDGLMKKPDAQRISDEIDKRAKSIISDKLDALKKSATDKDIKDFEDLVEMANDDEAIDQGFYENMLNEISALSGKPKAKEDVNSLSDKIKAIGSEEQIEQMKKHLKNQLYNKITYAEYNQLEKQLNDKSKELTLAGIEEYRKQKIAEMKRN